MFRKKLMFLAFVPSLLGSALLYSETQFPTVTATDLEKAIANSAEDSWASLENILQVSRNLGVEAATPILVENLSKSNTDLQHILISVLRQIKAPCHQVEDSLAPFLSSNIWSNKYDALGYLGDMKCVHYFSKIKNIYETDKNSQVRESALSALVQFGVPSDALYFYWIQNDVSLEKELRLTALIGLLKSSYSIDENLITESLNDSNSNIVNFALYICSLTPNEARLPKIQELKMQPQFSALAREAEIAITINSLTSKREIIETLFETLNTESREVDAWIINKLITEYGQEEKLKKMLTLSEVSRVQKSIIASGLRDEMKISEHEYNEILMQIRGAQ